MNPGAKKLIAAAAFIVGAFAIYDGITDIAGEENYMEEYADNNFNENPYGDENQQRVEQSPKAKKVSMSSKRDPEIEMKKIIDPKTGKVVAYIPFPEDWKISTEAITGPNGIIGKEYQFKLFDSNQRRPMSATQILNQELAPSIKQAGGQIVRTFPLPGIMQHDENYARQLYGSDQMQKSFDVIGVDLLDPNGKPNFLIVRQQAYSYGYGGNWGYTTHTLECDPSVYESAKKAFVFGIANSQSNPEQIAEYNRNEELKSRNSWADHNRRMRDNQVRFDAYQSDYVTTNNAINDMSMATWRNSNASSDRIQYSTVNGIHDQETIYDPANNTSYNVETGYDRYFMNGQGEYFGTNDQFYQPGSDLNLTGEWTESERRGN